MPAHPQPPRPSGSPQLSPASPPRPGLHGDPAGTLHGFAHLRVHGGRGGGVLHAPSLSRRGLPSKPGSSGLGKEPLAEAKVWGAKRLQLFPRTVFARRLLLTPGPAARPAGQRLKLHAWHRCSNFRWFPVGLFHLPWASEGGACCCHRCGWPRPSACRGAARLVSQKQQAVAGPIPVTAGSTPGQRLRSPRAADADSINVSGTEQILLPWQFQHRENG